MEGRESESLIVPKKAGNLLDGTRWREGGGQSSELHEGNMTGAQEH